MGKVILKELVNIYLGVTHTPEYVANGIPFLSVKDISGGKICFDDCKYISQEEYDSLSEGAKPKAGDMLFCRVGTIGKPIIVPKGTPLFGSFVSLGYLRNKDKSRCDLNYLKYWMYSNSFWKQVNSNVKGASQINLNTGWLSKFDIDLPDMTEQVYRISVLDKCKTLIERREQEIQVLDDLITARFVEMFENGKYPIHTVEEVCLNIVDCPHTTPKYEGELKNPAIRTSEIKKGFLTWDTMRYVSDDEYEERVVRLRPAQGDIVYGREGTFGNAAILPEGYKFCLGQRVMLLRPNYSLCTSEYLLHAVISDSVYRQAVEKNNASTVAHVNVKDVKQFNIPLPPIELQNQFAEFCKQLDKSKFAVQKALDEAQLLFNSLMQKYFGG